MKKKINNLSLICIVILLTSPYVFPQGADYTLLSAFNKALDWSKDAVGYSEYKWKKSFQELTDSLVGSTVLIERLLVDGNQISVTEGKASYKCSWTSSQSGWTEYFGFPADVYNHFEEYMSSSYRSATVYGGVGFALLIRDSSDRLAMEIGGNQTIRGLGRISQVSVQGSYVVMDIDLISWSII